MNNVNWDEMIFAGRNQQYGAYDLRKTYAGSVMVGFLGAMAVMCLFIASPLIVRLLAGEKVDPNKDVEVIFVDLIPPPSIMRDVQPQQQVKRAAMARLLPPKPTEKEVVDEPIPTVTQLTQDPAPFPDGQVEGTTTPIEVTPVAVAAPMETYNNGTVEVSPEFPGGMQGMMKYISKNLKYPATARRMGTEGTVYVSFVVDQNGNVVEVNALKGIGAGCDEEAIRVMSKMPAWKPGRQGNAAVRVKFVLPLKFVLGT